MSREFYSAVLPSTGIYCISHSGEKGWRDKYFDTLDQALQFIEQKKVYRNDLYFGLASYKVYSREKQNVNKLKSFFVDLDVGEGKEYATQEEAIKDLDRFITEVEMPPAYRINSGNGVHAYWPLQEEVTFEEWEPYAKKFKQLCNQKGLMIDNKVTADGSRVLRCPDTFNFKYGNKKPVGAFEGDVLYEWPFQAFKDFLGEVEDTSLSHILQMASQRGMTDEEIARANNYKYNFADIKQKSLEGTGCNQIKYIYDNAKHLLEPIWYAGLTIAVNCEDKAEAIHDMSKDYVNYSPEETERKASQIPMHNKNPAMKAFYSCEAFNDENPGGCEGCEHRGKIGSPLKLGRIFIPIALKQERLEQKEPEVITRGEYEGEETYEEEYTEKVEGILINQMDPNKVPMKYQVPDELNNYVLDDTGVLYKIRPPIVDKKGKETPQHPLVLLNHPLLATRRINSRDQGAMLELMVSHQRGEEETFTIPMSAVYSMERFKEIMAEKHIFPDLSKIGDLMSYVIDFANFLKKSSDLVEMHMQMGWTDEKEFDDRNFVIGNRLIKRDGTTEIVPVSHAIKGLLDKFSPTGNLETWKKSVNILGEESMEMHAFTFLTGYGSVLMNLTSSVGAAISLTGERGAAKTSAMFAATSIWGNPHEKKTSKDKSTDNALTTRSQIHKNIVMGVDELSNMLPTKLSSLIYGLSDGDEKMRLKASSNEEREVGKPASLIFLFTSNQALYEKLKALKADPDGELRRLIEFVIRTPRLLKERPDLGPGIAEPLKSHHGIAGEIFIRQLYKYTETEIKAGIAKWVNRLRVDFGHSTAASYYENLVGVTFYGGEIAHEAGLMDWHPEKIYGEVLKYMISIKNNVAVENDFDYVGFVNKYLSDNYNSMLIINKDKTLHLEPRSGQIKIKVENHLNRVLLEKSAFDTYVQEAQKPMKNIILSLKDAGIELTKTKSRLFSHWQSGVDKVLHNVYVLPLDAYDKLLKDAENGAEQAA